jgi:hypothetical protein
VLDHVYRAVAWQRVDQIRYNIFVPSLQFFFFNLCGGTLGTAATTGLLYQPQMIGEGDGGEIGGM